MATVTPQQNKRDMRIVNLRQEVDDLTAVVAKPPLKAVLKKIINEIGKLREQ